LRLNVESWLHEKNWRESNSPASTDILIVCGQADEEMTNAIARIQCILPKPAATILFSKDNEPNHLQADVYADGNDIKSALNNARLRLWQDREPSLTPIMEDDNHEEHTNGNHNHSHKEEEKPEENQGHEKHSHHKNGGNSKGHKQEDEGHDEHDHDDMKPGGLPMAERGEDRDGLKLDVLHIPMGPILYAWPAGLQLNVSMQGDVIQEAEFSPLENSGELSSYWNEPWEKILTNKQVTLSEAETRRIIAHLDSLQRLMAVSGDERSGLTIARLKHTAHSNRFTPEEFQAGFNRLKQRLTGGRLEKITEGIGRITKEEAKEFGLTGPALRACGEVHDQRQFNEGYGDFEPVIALGKGDACSRWHQWLTEIELSLKLIKGNNNLPIKTNNGQTEAPRGVLSLKEKPSAAIIKTICHLIKGQELAVARLLVASFDPDPDEL